MKYNPFKIILWLLFVLLVLLNSFRLFIYGFVISFIIVIIDRAFFGTRSRSDTQFLNLFFAFTLFFAVCYTFSPFFRNLEFEVSHPKWTPYTIEKVDKNSTEEVYNNQNVLKKAETVVVIYYLDEYGTSQKLKVSVKHYALPMFAPLYNSKSSENELNYIHKRGLDKLVDKQNVHLFKHPHKDFLKVFKGMDAFAVRHSIGSVIVLWVSYILCAGLLAYVIFKFRTLKEKMKINTPNERLSLLLIFGLFLASFTITITSVLHYLKF